jgi:hypothetical protein
MMSPDEQNTAISYYIEEVEQNNIENQLNIDDLLDKLNEDEYSYKDDLAVPHKINYHENYTVKELLIICEYYGFAKDLKANKLNKEQIIEFLVNYEINPINLDIVLKRQNMWFYINELKNDKFMKKFVLW